MKKMFGMISIAIALVSMSGCDKETKETTTDYILPEGLSDCKIFNMSNGFSLIKVVRCPLSSTSTTYQQGKTQSTASITDPNSTIVRNEEKQPITSAVKTEQAKEVMINGVVYRAISNN